LADILDELIKLNRDLRVTLLSKWQQAPRPKSGKSWPLLYLAVQVVNLHEAIELLASRGFGREAGILIRSMFEATVNVMWIAQDPEQRLDRFAAYRYFAAEQYRDLRGRLPRQTKQSLEERKQYELEGEQIRQESQKAKDQYGFRREALWSGKPLKEMARDVGWLSRYEAIYKIYSDVSHANIGSSQDFVSGDSTGAVFIQRKAQFAHCNPVMREAYCCLTTTLGLADAYVGLGIEAEIDEAMKKVNSILSGSLEV